MTKLLICHCKIVYGQYSDYKTITVGITNFMKMQLQVDNRSPFKPRAWLNSNLNTNENPLYIITYNPTFFFYL